MTGRITRSVDQFKSSIRETLNPQTIQRICHDAGHRWRRRTLDPVTTFQLFALQMLNGNTACAHVARLLPGVNVSDSGYCQARTRIPLAVFRAVFLRFSRMLLDVIDTAETRWRGHRVFFIDGSSCSMPDMPALQKAFGQPKGQKPGCGFPKAKLVGLFHAGSGLLVDLFVDRLYAHESRLAPFLFRHLRQGDVLVGDRAFGSYVLLAMLVQRGAHAVMRQHQRRPTDFRCGRRIGWRDRIVKLTKPKQRPKWLSAEAFEALPESLSVRRVEYYIQMKGYRSQRIVLTTTLLDAERYPRADLASLYGTRWQVETWFRHLKQTMTMDMLRCKTPDGVRKELWMFGIVYNQVRTLMVQAGRQQKVPPERISFIDVLRWLCHRRRGQVMPRFVVNPDRPGRHQPRVVKRRPKQYPRLTHPRERMHNVMATWIL